MKYATYNKVTNEALKDFKLMEFFLINEVKRVKVSNLLKSIRLMNPVIEIGYNGDDFIKNTQTMVIRFDAYKVPRIIKNSLLKKYKNWV